MKKIILLAAFACFCMAAVAQEAKPVFDKRNSPDIEAIQTAAALAQYGYRHSSPTALIEAARIFGTVHVRDAEFEAVADNAQNVAEKETGVSYDSAELLADAKGMAGKDKTLLTLIKRAEEEMKDASENTRGVVGGPQALEGRVYAQTYMTYNAKFWAAELAEVVVIGDGDTDLDLYIYDANGNMVACDNDMIDTCVCRWVPSWTGTFIIKVVNRGDVYNNFVLVTN